MIDTVEMTTAGEVDAPQTPKTPKEEVRTEEFQITGDKLITKIKELLHEGNVRRIVIKNEEGHAIAEFPLMVGVVGALLLPVWAALGAIAALVANLTILVERHN